jgi:hypothetical protein
VKKPLLVLVAIAVLGAVACSRTPPEPTLQFATVGFILHLPEGMQSALNAAAPGFKAINPTVFRSGVAQDAAVSGGGLQAEFATLADFDGDGSKDVIVEGAEPGDSALHVVAIMNGAKPRAFEVMNFPLYDADAVGEYLVQPIGAAKGTFEVVDDPDSTTVFTFKGGHFTGKKIGS